MIAREGLPFIAIGLVLTVTSILAASRWDSKVLLGMSAVFALLTVFTVFFFRDPDRSFEPEPGILVAPADGKVLAVEEIGFHEYVGGDAIKISIFLSVFDIHVNRVPADGAVEYVKYIPGEFHMAFVDKASELNEQTEIGIRTASGHKVVVKQIAGLIARRIVCCLTEGMEVVAGDRFGLIRFGSRTELFVPVGTDIQIKAGQRVKGSETVMGFLPPSPALETESDQSQGDNVKI